MTNDKIFAKAAAKKEPDCFWSPVPLESEESTVSRGHPKTDCEAHCILKKTNLSIECVLHEMATLHD